MLQNFQNDLFYVLHPQHMLNPTGTLSDLL
jgi:hypothetical protein